jgi:hypothetical protein
MLIIYYQQSQKQRSPKIGMLLHNPLGFALTLNLILVERPNVEEGASIRLAHVDSIDVRTPGT